jgi:hypothetical protein
MRGLWQTRDDRVDAGLNATLDLCTIFVPGLSTPGIEVITKAKCGAAGTTVPPATVGFLTAMFALPESLSHVTNAAFAQARLRLGSGSAQV